MTTDLDITRQTGDGLGDGVELEEIAVSGVHTNCTAVGRQSNH